MGMKYPVQRFGTLFKLRLAQIFLMTFLTVEENHGYVAMSNNFVIVQFFRKIEPGERLDLKVNTIVLGTG